MPVIRGLSGVRVLLSQDGIAAWDASAMSPDHASTVEAVLTERIELLRGPSTVSRAKPFQTPFWKKTRKNPGLSWGEGYYVIKEGVVGQQKKINRMDKQKEKGV